MGAPRDSTALILAKRRPSREDKAPRQEELAGPRRRGPGKRSLPGRPSPYKTIQEQSIQDKRSRPRQVELAGKAIPGSRPHLRRRAPAEPGDRQASEPGELPAPTRSRPRQGTCRGELRCAPALQLTRTRVALRAIT